MHGIFDLPEIRSNGRILVLSLPAGAPVDPNRGVAKDK